MHYLTSKLLLCVCIIFLFFISANAWAAKPVPFCGDGKCRGEETAVSCPADCSPASICGDGICSSDETFDTCPSDCDPPPPPTCNGDGVCNSGEDCLSCPNDCAGVTGGKPSNRYCCGADTCDLERCGPDCGAPNSEPYCGDSFVNQESEECDDGGESALCDSDCTLAICGDGTLNGSAGEECDDGNNNSNDGCDSTCLTEVPPIASCGDGAVNQASEECDDGNLVSGDGCDANCKLEPLTSVVPYNQFNVGDSIGEGEAANGTIGDPNHQTVWSTGYDGGDTVNAFNERFESTNSVDYYENNAARDPVFNHAISGSIMADFADQVNGILTALYTAEPPYEAGMISILLGNNDVCASSLDAMTDPVLFEAQYRAGLNILANSSATSSAYIHVSSIPAIYWLWNAKRTNFWCRVFAWPFVPCENLLDNPADDCANSESRMDPDTIYNTGATQDGPNCIRRKTFHAKIRDIYNPILRDVLQEYIDDGSLPNAYFIDVFNIQFENSDVNSGDCFHPSETGHALLSEKGWCLSQWGAGDPQCNAP